MTIPLQFASLYDRQEVFVWSNCLLDLGTGAKDRLGVLFIPGSVDLELGEGPEYIIFRFLTAVHHLSLSWQCGPGAVDRPGVRYLSFSHCSKSSFSLLAVWTWSCG